MHIREASCRVTSIVAGAASINPMEARPQEGKRIALGPAVCQYAAGRETAGRSAENEWQAAHEASAKSNVTCIKWCKLLGVQEDQSLKCSDVDPVSAEGFDKLNR